MTRPVAPRLAAGLLVLAYVVFFGSLSLRRHQNLQTNALDLGYTDQVVWNTLHGRPFRFSTYVDAAFHLDIPIQDFAQPDMLLGYHVEPALLAIAPLYLLHDGPETLLWLQTVALALGAVPVYLLARQRLIRRGYHRGLVLWTPVAFVLIYLLAPPLEAANLSDFHALALAPVLLLAAFYALESDHAWGFVGLAFFAAMCKEEVGLLVAMMGLWAAFVRRRWLLGLGVFVAGAGWSLLCFAAIMPHYSGLVSSAFVVRYGQFGDSPVGIARTMVRQPLLFLDWLRQPDVLRYVRDLWLSSGGLALLSPLSLAMAAPSVAINAFSRYGWMRSGGGHYSVTIVPFLVIAAILGVDGVAAYVAKWLRPRSASTGPRQSDPVSHAADAAKYSGYELVSTVLVSAGLIVALLHHVQNGVSPLSRRFSPIPLTEHARRAQPFFEQVNNLPPDVPLSVSSSLYPHVAHRQWVYLFPTVSDADYILLDASGPASPVQPGDHWTIVRELLDYAEFGIVAADHGFLLLERGLDEYRMSPAFYDVFLAGSEGPPVALAAEFGGLLKLEGFAVQTRPVVRPQLVVEITTYWQALAPLDSDYRLVFFFWNRDGRRIRVQPEETVVHWFPTWLWEPGQRVKITLPPLPVGDLPHLGVAVVKPGAQDRDILGRLAPILPTGDRDLSLWEDNTILELTTP